MCDRRPLKSPDAPSVPEVVTRSKIEQSKHKACDPDISSHQEKDTRFGYFYS